MKTKLPRLTSTLFAFIAGLLGMCLLSDIKHGQASDLRLHGNPHFGVVGQVFTVGFCAVEGLPGQDCSPQPRQSTVGVLSASGDPIGQFTTTADGRFHVYLPIGDYILVLLDPEGEPFHPFFSLPVPIAVERKKLTTVTMTYDVQIR